MRSCVLLLLLPALLLASTACGGGSSDDDDTPPTPTTAESFCRDFSTRVCAGLSACGCRFDVRPYDADGCVDARTADCVAGLGVRVTPDIQAGRARFDEPTVTACLAATKTMADACVLDTGFAAPLPDECLAIVVSTASVGEICRLSGGGLAFCGATAEGVCLPREGGPICTALPTTGTSCLQGLCAPGLVCDGETCAAPRAAGADCHSPLACQAGLVCLHGECGPPGVEAETCQDERQCQAGLTCASGHCTAATALGDGCNGPGQCGAAHACERAPETRTCTDPDAAGSACMSDTCAETFTCESSSMTCRALPGDGETCVDNQCAEGLNCLDGVGTCAPLPSLGETCAIGNRFCAVGLGCRFSDNTCQSPPGASEECLQNGPDYVCGAGLGCQFGNDGVSTCVALGGVGADCTNDRVCGEGTYCELSTLKCANRLADGAACQDGNECQIGHECAVGPAGPRCAPIPGRGVPCFFDCADGLVCKGPGGECAKALCTIP